MADIPRKIVGIPRYKFLIREIPWDQVLGEAEDLHDKLVIAARAGLMTHKTGGMICGDCVRSILLEGEDDDDVGGTHRLDIGVH